jgi:hypothetical protein
VIDNLGDVRMVVTPVDVCRTAGHSLIWVEVNGAGEKCEACALCSLAWRLAHRAGSEQFADAFVSEIRRRTPPPPPPPAENLDPPTTTE